MRCAAAFLLVLLSAGAASGQQQAPTPIPQSVVVPSLPDQPNKEGVVKPSGAMKTNPEGYVRNDASPVEPGKPATGGGVPPAAPGPGIGAPAMPPPPAPGPHSAPAVNEASITVRGVVKAYAPGVSVTIREANGKNRIVLLADKAFVYDGVAAGDKVVVRVPLQKPADGKHADRVEKQKTSKAAPRSKFSQAQSPKR